MLRASYFLALGILVAPRADARTITVTSLADDTVVDGLVTLREAILEANTDAIPDEIVFATGPGTIVLSGTQLPLVIQDLILTGPGASLMTIDGNQTSRVLQIAAGVSVTLSGLTIRGGQVASGNGGGILNSGALTIADSVLAANEVAGNGGGVWSDGSLTIRESTFEDNTALNGGALYSQGTLQISGSTFQFNFTGGIAPFAGGGGAIGNTGTATITSSLFAVNQAANGGAVVGGGTLTLTNSTVVYNEALNNGGGISSGGSASWTVTACTIAENRADGNDDGLGSGGGINVGGGSLRLDTTIVADNFSTDAIRQDLAGTVDTASSGNLVSVNTGITGISHGANANQIGTAASPLDPMLDFLDVNGGPTLTRALLPGSLALDRASAGACPGFDQRGIPRPLDGDNDTFAVCDIGAYEAFAVASQSLSFFTLPPCRVADTRGAAGPSGGPVLSADTTRFFPAAGVCGIPADARAVALNATVVNGTDVGNLRLFPAGAAAPEASTINFAANRARANNSLLPLGAAGQIAVRCDMPEGSTRMVHLVLDVYGYLK